MREKHGDDDGFVHGWWCQHSHSRFGFGFWFGLFILGWGTFELLKSFGFIKGIDFPFWPILLFAIGLSMVLKRI